MKQYCILSKDGHEDKLCSTNSLEYGDYLMADWLVTFTGNRRECQIRIEETELSY